MTDYSESTPSPGLFDYASPDTPQPVRPPSGVAQVMRRLARAMPAIALAAVVVWMSVLYVTAKSGLDATVFRFANLKISEDRFTLGLGGPFDVRVEADVWLPIVVLGAAAALVRAVGQARWPRMAGRPWRDAVQAARWPLLAGGIWVACGTAVLWARWPAPPELPYSGPTGRTYAVAIARLETADVLADVAVASAHGDHRLLGIGGAGGDAPPGVADFAARQGWYTAQFGIRHFGNTSDCIDGSEYGRLQWLTYDYAIRYNTLLLARSASATTPPVTRPASSPLDSPIPSDGHQQR